jgi:hypothetical protein
MQSQLCPPPLKSRPYVSGPQVYYLHVVNFPHIGGFQYDVPFALPFPCSKFFLLSATGLTNTLYLSLKPIGKQNPGSGGITIAGTEEWFPMTTLSSGLTGQVRFSVVKFKDPTSNIFLSMGTESGAGSNFVLACAPEDGIEVLSGPWGG